MTGTTIRFAGAVALTFAMAACGGSKEAASTDTSMGKDLQMAAGAASTQPALGDTAAAGKAAAAKTPAAKTPSAKTPAASAARGETTKPAEPARPAGEIAAGTSLVLHPGARVCTNTNKVGEVVDATVADAVQGTNGVSIPAGAIVKLRIVALKRSENVKDPIDMGFEPVSVTFDGHTYEFAAKVTNENIERIRNEPQSKDVQKVVGGAVIGAVAGKLIGKSTKGAVIGAAAGAAAGAGAAAATANYEGCIAQGSNMTIKLTSPVSIK